MLFLESRRDERVSHWPLRGPAFTVGRGESCDIVVNDPSVSREHFRLSVHGQQIVVEDLGSRNGVTLDGDRVKRAEVAVDRWFVAGSVLFAVRRGLDLRPPHTTNPPGLRREKSTPPPAPREESGAGWRAAAPPGGLSLAVERMFDPDGVVRDPQEAANALIEFSRLRWGVAGVALIRFSDAGSEVVSNTGELLPEADHQALLRAMREQPGGQRPVQCDGALAVPVPGAEAWLVFHPPPNSAELLHQRATAWMCGAFMSIAALQPGALGGSIVPAPPAADDVGETLVAESPAFLETLKEADALAGSSLQLMIVGEAGVGKGVVARRIHQRRFGPSAPLVVVNCAALPKNSFDAEVFGVDHGAAADAEPRAGAMAKAAGGTLILERIDVLSLEQHQQMLHVFLSREYTPVGADATRRLAARIIGTSEEDLDRKLRSRPPVRDLFEQLLSAKILVPPLRRRIEDILPLARHFTQRYAKAQASQCNVMEYEAARTLLGYSWPGNVRELENAIARAVALTAGAMLTTAALPREICEGSDRITADALLGMLEDFRTARAAFERLYFKRLREQCGGNIAEAARRSGLRRGLLEKKFAELGLGASPPHEP